MKNLDDYTREELLDIIDQVIEQGYGINFKLIDNITEGLTKAKEEERKQIRSQICKAIAAINIVLKPLEEISFLLRPKFTEQMKKNWEFNEAYWKEDE